MIERNGEIVDICNGLAAIRVEPASACSSCGTRSVCGAGRVEAALVYLPLAAPARCGDRITLGLADGGLTRAAFLAYLLPAMSTLAGALLLAGAGDLAAVAGALAGLGLGLIALRRWSRACAPLAVTPAPTFLKPFGDT